MKSKGFTLIELMIVVAIIAIIAAIAIPNLLRSRMAANETAAVAACKAYATAENIYRRTDYNKDGVLEYSGKLSGDNSLFENTAAAGDVALIDRSFANAEGLPSSVGGTATPKSGYVFQCLNANASAATPFSFVTTDGTGANHQTLGYGLCAMSNQYDGVGRNMFQISNDGTIYQKDLGLGSPVLPSLPSYSVDTTWVVSE